MIINDKTNKQWLNTGFAKSLTRRIGMGITNNEIVFIFPKDNCDLNKLATLFQNQKCSNAIALDGGGSQFVGQVVNGKVVHLDNNKNNRPVSTWILIYLKDNNSSNETFPKTYQVTAEKLNMRTKPEITSPLHKAIIPAGYLKKGDKVTIFEIKYNEKEKRYWAKSYGYWLALNYLKQV